jgi:hypothetical protein
MHWAKRNACRGGVCSEQGRMDKAADEQSPHPDHIARLLCPVWQPLGPTQTRLMTTSILTGMRGSRRVLAARAGISRPIISAATGSPREALR